MSVQTSIKLVPFTEADIDRLIGWVPSAEFLLQWAGPAFSYPLTRAQLTRHLAKAAGENTDRRIYKAVDTISGEVLGHGEIGGIDCRNRSAALSRILVGPSGLRGRGIGEQIVRALLRVAFDELALHRVGLNVFDFNKAAIHIYEKVGFTQEGLLRDARKHGGGGGGDDEYWNLCVMGILEHEWEAENLTTEDT